MSAQFMQHCEMMAAVDSKQGSVLLESWRGTCFTVPFLRRQYGPEGQTDYRKNYSWEALKTRKEGQLYTETDSQ